jgi:hypothetical protein
MTFCPKCFRCGSAQNKEVKEVATIIVAKPVDAALDVEEELKIEDPIDPIDPKDVSE